MPELTHGQGAQPFVSVNRGDYVQLVAHDSETLVGWPSSAFPVIPEPAREKNVLVPRFFLPFSLLDVP